MEALLKSFYMAEIGWMIVASPNYRKFLIAIRIPYTSRTRYKLLEMIEELFKILGLLSGLPSIPSLLSLVLFRTMTKDCSITASLDICI
jgi:hypothetical protein